jgi:serine/threonine-protein kinase
VIVFECLTGQRPFQAYDFDTLVELLWKKERPVPSRLGAVPSGFDHWFARATARNIDDRFQSAQELVDALRPICGSVETERMPPLVYDRISLPGRTMAAMTRTSDADPLPYLSRRPKLMWSMGAALVVGLAANAYFFLNRPSSSPVPPPSVPTLTPTVVLPASRALPSGSEPTAIGVPSLESGAGLGATEQATKPQALPSDPVPPSSLFPLRVSSPPRAARTTASPKKPRKIRPEVEGTRRAPNAIDTGESRDDWSRPEF